MFDWSMKTPWHSLQVRVMRLLYMALPYLILSCSFRTYRIYSILLFGRKTWSTASFLFV